MTKLSLPPALPALLIWPKNYDEDEKAHDLLKETNIYRNKKNYCLDVYHKTKIKITFNTPYNNTKPKEKGPRNNSFKDNFFHSIHGKIHDI